MTEIRVELTDHLPEILAKLRAAPDRDVTLVIPDDAPVLLTASEFRALATLAEQSGKQLTLATRDPLRRQFALMFGMAVDELPPAVEIASDQSYPLLTSGDDETDSNLGPVAESGRRRRAPLRKLAWLVAIVALMALTWWLASPLFISAEVKVGWTRQVITSAITIPIATDAAEAEAGAIASEPITFDLTTALTKPTTGTVSVGEVPASGELVLRNTSDQEVTIPAGTTILSFEGSKYVTDSEVNVPAAGADGSSPGESAVTVTASDPGTVGNQDIGLLTGRMDNGVFYSNRNNPVGGGTDLVVKVVSEDDLAALRQAATDSLTTRATTELIGGKVVIPDSIAFGDGNYLFDQEVGAQADSVSITATVRFTANAFDPTSLQSAANASLVAAVPSGWEIDPATISYTDPVQNGTELQVTVAAETVPAVDSGLQSEIAHELAGMSAAEATDYLEAREEIESFTVNYSPGILRETMPRSDDRITVTGQ